MEWEKLGQLTARAKKEGEIRIGGLYVKTIGEKFMYKFVARVDKNEYVVAPAKDEKYNAYITFGEDDFYFNVPQW